MTQEITYKLRCDKCQRTINVDSENHFIIVVSNAVNTPEHVLLCLSEEM